MDEENAPKDAVVSIRDAVGAYRTAQIYITFAELGIGAALEEGPLDLQELARRVVADPKALRRFLDAAIAFNLIREDAENCFALTPTAAEVLSPGGSYSIANLLRLESAFYQRWGRLAQAVRTGTRPPENRQQEDDPDWVRRFTLALYDNARPVAPAIAEAVDRVLPPPSERVLELIDIGGGHGAYSLAVAERRPDLTAVVFDLPQVIEVTAEIVARSAVSDRVSTVAGDFHRDPLGEQIDVALLFGVLHGETEENAPRLLARIFDALSYGGHLLIRSHGRSAGGSQHGEREITDLHMLLSTQGGSARGGPDTTVLVQQAGFEVLDPVEVHPPGSGTLLVFRKGS